ncbi:MAG: dCTP deaminase [Oscillospiraceae bacterium]|nr:dCTP deaminase [Oscillospiraceae bacterium]
MLLSGSEIKRQMALGNLVIDPFSEEQLNPNSYNLTLDREMQLYTAACLDVKQKNATRTILIPEEGIVLEPFELYLVRSREYTETHGFVPMVQGRSSLGRLGLSVHITSGFGDIGFCGNWTLQLLSVKPLRIYPGMKFCQIYYQELRGAESQSEYASEKYQGGKEIQASKSYLDFQDR